jgi:hypothetical protein
MSEIKQIQIAGDIAAALIPSGGKRRTARKKNSLTVNESPITGAGYNNSINHEQVKAVSLQNQYNETIHRTEPIQHTQKREDTPTTIHIDNSYQPYKEIEKPKHHHQEPKEHQNIILGPKKKSKPKLILSRKKKYISLQHQPHLIKSKDKHKTRKVSISLSAHKRRITRARKVSKDTKKIPLEKIRTELIKRKLIKENSKAPESVLRQIYTDAMVVAQKAL